MDHEFLIAKFRLKLKKIGKTPRPFRYDLNQIPYDYKVEVTNRFKGLDLIDRVPDELWVEVFDIVQEAGSRPSPRKRNAKRQNGCLRRTYQPRQHIKNQRHYCANKVRSSKGYGFSSSHVWM